MAANFVIPCDRLQVSSFITDSNLPEKLQQRNEEPVKVL
jgi:hypothetical protein